MPDPTSTLYASELFGVYKPLLGWRGTTAATRVQAAVARNLELELERRVYEAMAAGAPSPPSVPPRPPAGGPTPRPTPEPRPDLTRAVLDEGRRMMRDLGRPLTASEWTAAVGSAGRPAGGVRASAPPAGPASSVAPAPALAAPTGSLAASPLAAGATMAAVRDDVARALLTELATTATHVLDGLAVRPRIPTPRLLDPLADFDPAVSQAVLSPIGILQLYRQLFYDLDTFLGPPVGHVWVSPGSTVEVVETHSRRTTVEREDTASVDTVTRSEREVELEDELSTSIKDEDSRSLQVGASASLSGGFPGVVQGSASASFSLEQNHQQTREEAHRKKRTQTERITDEIRRSFRTTLRTTVDTHDTSSRRYVLTNATAHLVNYELRRKMRRVGVAVQHLGTRLCWQVFLDDPGFELDPGEFLHAATADRGPAPVAPVPPTTPPAPAPTEQRATLSVRFPFAPLDAEARDSGMDEDYRAAPWDPAIGVDVHEGGVAGQIRMRQVFPVQPPAGFRLRSAVINAWTSDGSSSTPPHVVPAPVAIGDDGASVTIGLESVNFNDSYAIVFALDAVFAPVPAPPSSPADAARVQEEQAAEDAARDQRRREDELARARERLKLERTVRPRPAADLREEERILVYRLMLRKLRLPTLASDDHLTVELLRTVFDVERLLYFVAQDWWRPRWYRRTERGVEHYPITEECDPARMGASLGWSLQVDGDSRRDAFLNTPWVKAVLPIRPGMEAAAIRWLTSAGVEGTAGLGERYGGPEPELAGLTLQQALVRLAGQIRAEGPDGGTASETVYERGFDELGDGFRATSAPFAVFDRWVEILPTEQVVAVEYTPPT